MRLPSLAWLDAGRHLHMTDEDGQESFGLESLTWGSWSGAADSDVHSWPTWAPDGKRVASFRLARSSEGMSCHVRITDAGGIDAIEIAELGGRLPIYLQWAPRGDRLLVLTQSDDLLLLDEAFIESPGVLIRRLEGSPLFFHHASDGRLAIFVGETGRSPRMVVSDPGGKTHDLAGEPGNFCAPIVLGDEVAYVRIDLGRPELHVAPLDGGPTRKLRTADGLASMLPSPDGTRLAWSVATDGTGHAYKGIEQIDPQTGLSERITDAEVIAYAWLPDGSGLVTASKQESGAILWARVGLDGHTLPLGELFPTRDLRFYLRFFEQFTQSHPLVSADGRHMVIAGGLVGQDDPRGTPRLWALPVEGGPPEEIGEGVFATFPAAPHP